MRIENILEQVHIWTLKQLLFDSGSDVQKIEKVI